jgi:hypothetical protein
MHTPTVPSPAIADAPTERVAPTARRGDWTGTLTSAFAGRSPAAAADAIWVPAVSGLLILAVGVLSLATDQPWLFAGLGPTALVVASSPGHPTTRFHAIVVGHLTAMACAFAVLLLLGAGGAPSLFATHAIPLSRVWASAFAVALTALVQPSLRAYHPPAAATALLVTLGAYRMSWKVALSMLAGVLVVALLGEWLQRLRLRERAALAARA